MLFLVIFVAFLSLSSCQFQEIYLQCTGKLVGLQELGNSWSLIVGVDNFTALSEFVRDLNQAIAEESLRSDVEVTRNIAHLLCDAHDVMFDMISQFHPTKPINHELLMVFKEKLWDQWLGTINRFNGAICELDLPAELQEAASIRIDLASMKPIKIHKFHGKYEKLKGHLKGLHEYARTSISRVSRLLRL